MADEKKTALPRPLTATEEKKVTSAANDYGIDPQVIALWLITYGPKVFDLIVKWFKGNKDEGMRAGKTSCPEHVKKSAKKQVERLQEALAAAVCLEHCLNCCEEK